MTTPARTTPGITNYMVAMRDAQRENKASVEVIPTQPVTLYMSTAKRPFPQAPMRQLIAKLSVNGSKPITVTVVLDEEDIAYCEARGADRATRLHRKMAHAIGEVLVARVA